jgi:hypothetical protein
MKKYILSFLVISIFTSCSKQPKCDNEESTKLAKSLIVQEMKEKTGMALSMFGVDADENLEKFVNENIELINVRTNDKDEDLKKCGCSSQISFKFSDDFIEKLQEKGKGNFMVNIIKKMMTQKIDYNYTLQIINKNEELFIEGIVPSEELQGVFTNYLMYAPLLKKEDENEKMSDKALLGNEAQTVHQNETDVSVNSGEIITEKSYIYKERDYTSKTKMYLIKGDIFDIGENKNGFYDIYYKGIKGDKNIEGYIPEDEMKLLYLDRYGNKTYIIE